VSPDTWLGLRHGQGRIYAVVTDPSEGHATSAPVFEPRIIEEMTPARARAVAADLLRRADELDPPPEPDPFDHIWHLPPEAVEELSDALHWAASEARPIRLVIDGGVKIDVGDGTGWTTAYGHTTPNYTRERQQHGR
jgi:hypothetical protein